MARFEFPNGIRVHKVGKLLGYFDFVDTELGIIFRDWRLVDGRNGVFVSSAFRTWGDKDDPKYSQYVEAAYTDDDWNQKGKEYFEEVAKAAYAAYEASKDTKSTKNKRSGRGAVTTPPTAPNTPDDDLPF